MYRLQYSAYLPYLHALQKQIELWRIYYITSMISRTFGIVLTVFIAVCVFKPDRSSSSNSSW